MFFSFFRWRSAASFRRSSVRRFRPSSAASARVGWYQRPSEQSSQGSMISALWAKNPSMLRPKPANRARTASLSGSDAAGTWSAASHHKSTLRLRARSLASSHHSDCLRRRWYRRNQSKQVRSQSGGVRGSGSRSLNAAPGVIVCAAAFHPRGARLPRGPSRTWPSPFERRNLSAARYRASRSMPV